MPDRNIRPDTIHGAIRFGNAGLSIFAVTMGLTLLLQGRSRMSTPGWDVALSVPVSPRFWGVYMLIGGCLMLTGLLLKGRGRGFVAVGATAVAFALWARAVASFLALGNPNASGTGPQLYTALALIFLANGVIHYRLFTR